MTKRTKNVGMTDPKFSPAHRAARHKAVFAFLRGFFKDRTIDYGCPTYENPIMSDDVNYGGIWVRMWVKVQEDEIKAELRKPIHEDR